MPPRDAKDGSTVEVYAADEATSRSLASLTEGTGLSLLGNASTPEALQTLLDQATGGAVLVLKRNRHARARSDLTHSESDPALTPRELEILGAMADGASNKVIARRLGISFHTVKFHVASILEKLDAETRTEAVAAGARLGLVML